MNLKPELVNSLNRINFISATEVQERAIPELLLGKDAIVRAKTGTGKTAAFLLPIFNRINKHAGGPEALIIVPTRELALQVSEFSDKVGSNLGLSTTTVYGGASINMQMREIRNGVNIVVGTPGRLLDLIERRAINLDRIRFLVLDEADVMLDMGFIEDIESIISRVSSDKQFMLFSATMPREIVKVAQRYAKNELIKITVGEEEDLAVSTIKQNFVIVPHRLKFAALLAYISQYSPKKAIIFARTKFEANTLHRLLVSQKMHAILMHGGLTQSMREKSLGHFKSGAQFLIATNVAARGLDIADISDIINFGCPDDPNIYIHRIGRSARMGKDGRALTIVDSDSTKLLRDIQDYANVKMDRIELDLNPFQNIVIPHEHRTFGRSRGGFNRGGFNRNRGGEGRGEGRGEGGRGNGPRRFFRGGGQRGGGGHRGGFNRDRNSRSR
ncbi:MAG: DEAD/DEAH box helicase [Candidatus Micrarchaeota archaeon]|nr:DEAD/DEAH box helicase [Candidatus Micrarchaeota archaeon]MDE1864163.1 DEAD/DEAH box helicase [Candidatus Micrarchaeota archaeon]